MVECEMEIDSALKVNNIKVKEYVECFGVPADERLGAERLSSW